MMLKKFSLLILFLIFISCGYESVYTKKNILNYNFSVSKLNFDGDRDINLKIKEKLNNYIGKNQSKNFELKIYSISKKTTIAKNIKGEALSFKNTTMINTDVLIEDKILNSFRIVETFNYNNNKNISSLKRYEKEIKNNLAETATNKLIFKLSSFQ